MLLLHYLSQLTLSIGILLDKLASVFKILKNMMVFYHFVINIIGEKVEPSQYFKKVDCEKMSSSMFQNSGLQFHLPQPQVTPFNPFPQYDNSPSENQDPTKAVPLLTSTVIKTTSKAFTSQTIKGTPDIEMPPSMPTVPQKSVRQRILRSQIDSPISPRYCKIFLSQLYIFSIIYHFI